MSRETDPRHARTALALREALLRLLERKSFDKITVREICAEAGVHNATFFRHHADKNALLDHVAADQIDRLVDFSLPAGPRLEGNRALCEYVSAHWVLWKALLTGGARAAMREQYLAISKSVAAHYKGEGSWLPEDLAITCSTMLIVETVSWWLGQDKDAHSPQEVAEILDRLVRTTTMRPPPEAPPG